jgi:hypothetical protein
MPRSNKRKADSSVAFPEEEEDPKPEAGEDKENKDPSCSNTKVEEPERLSEAALRQFGASNGLTMAIEYVISSLHQRSLPFY